MELNREDAGEMYLPDDQGEYLPEEGTQNFSIQDLSDVLMSLESQVTVVQPPAEEYALLLEVTMADQPGHPHPPAFSWNAGMVLHVLKGDPVFQDLEHVQVDSPGTTYLFFCDKQGCRGPKQDVTENLRTHVAEAFSEWISWSAHFVVILLLLVEGWWRAMAALDRQCQRSWVEHLDHPVPHVMSSKSDSMPPLVGSAPPSAAQMGQLEGGSCSLRVPSSQPRGRPPKQCPAKDGVRNLLLSSLDRDGRTQMGTSR